MIIDGGTSYFTLDYAVGEKSRLPEKFTGVLDAGGNGCVVIRYGGRRIAVIVHHRELCHGWRTFIRRAKVMTGNTLLVACSDGRVLSILKFERGMGMKTAWDSNANPFDIESELLEEDDIIENAPILMVRTSFFPQYMALFYALPSGVCTYKQSNYHAMRVPYNLAQHLRASRKSAVTIRSGERVFENISVAVGYFRGTRWNTLVEECDFDIGFKIFFFVNAAEEFEMIVVGFDNLEAVYEWSRTYYKFI